jgi:hypothetical protein
MGQVYVDGVKVSDFTSTSGSDPAGNFGSSTWNMGSRNDGASRPLDGQIREVVVYPTHMSEEQIQTLTKCLKWKVRKRSA